MSCRYVRSLMPLLACLALAGSARAAEPAAVDLNDLQEQALKAAVAKVAPCVVQINTSGGADTIAAGPRGATFRKALGPTTGFIIGADGYVISSAFNFVNKPSAIFVALPGQAKRFPAG